MGAFILGMVGFALYFVYDLNSIRWNSSILQKFFGAGCLCVFVSTLWTMWDGMKNDYVITAWGVGFGIAGMIFLVLLIYTLFFALPFEQTYLEENQMRLAYTEGVYALCRHPGVLWFAGLYLCLWGVTGDVSRGSYFISMIVWNYLYIIFQDVWTFPKTFINYGSYKEKTPFLIPNAGSIRAWVRRSEAAKKRSGGRPV